MPTKKAPTFPKSVLLMVMSLALGGCATKHWSYVGETGPSEWAKLSEGAQCGGRAQSPVNLFDGETSPLPSALQLDDASFDYSPMTSIRGLVNNGHTLQYEFAAGENSVRRRGEVFALTQVHFHSPSEHTFNGVRFPMEAHFVHRSPSGQFLVLALMVVQGEPSAALNFLNQFLPVAPGERKELAVRYRFDEPLTLGGSGRFFVYRGSLTTPPCTETVEWVVYEDPLFASPSQLEEVQKLLPADNFRAVQPLNGRDVFVGNP